MIHPYHFNICQKSLRWLWYKVLHFVIKFIVCWEMWASLNARMLTILSHSHQFFFYFVALIAEVNNERFYKKCDKQCFEETRTEEKLTVVKRRQLIRVCFFSDLKCLRQTKVRQKTETPKLMEGSLWNNRKLDYINWL